MTSNLEQGLLSMCSLKSAFPLNLKVYKACLCVKPTGYIRYTFSSPPLMLSGLSCFQMGTCFRELNFASTADSKASKVRFPDLPNKVAMRKRKNLRPHFYICMKLHDKYLNIQETCKNSVSFSPLSNCPTESKSKCPAILFSFLE